MRVKDRQKRANEAFTKPLTTHLTRGKGDFSCRATIKLFIFDLAQSEQDCPISMSHLSEIGQNIL